METQGFTVHPRLATASAARAGMVQVNIKQLLKYDVTFVSVLQPHLLLYYTQRETREEVGPIIR